MAAIQLDSKSVSQLSHLQGRSSSSLLKANDILNINHRKNHIIFNHESIDGVFMHVSAVSVLSTNPKLTAQNRTTSPTIPSPF